MCDLSGWKPRRAKVKCKGRSIIDSDEDAEGELEPKWWKVDLVLVVEILQPAGTSLSLFWDLISMLWEHVMEQWKQTMLLEQIAHIQELDHVDWIQMEMGNSETGSEDSEEELEGNEEWDGSGVKDKGKGKEKERVEDGNGNEGRDGNGGADGEMLQ